MVVCEAYGKNSYSSASKESVPAITMSHFSSCEEVSLSGTLQRDLQRLAMPSETPLEDKGKPQQDTCLVDDCKPF